MPQYRDNAFEAPAKEIMDQRGPPSERAAKTSVLRRIGRVILITIAAPLGAVAMVSFIILMGVATGNDGILMAIAPFNHGK